MAQRRCLAIKTLSGMDEEMSIIYKNWFVHNVIAHPLMQILKPFKNVSVFIHDVTLPEEFSLLNINGGGKKC